MTYERFEDLPVWQAAMDFALRVFDLTADRALAGAGDLREQLRRSTLSTCLNVAEGFERGTTSELLYFLYVARGSAGESRSALRFCERYPPTSHRSVEVSALIGRAENISRQLRGWADSLQNGDVPGQRYLTDPVREEYGQRRRAAEFVRKLDEIRRQGQAGREADEGK